VPVVIVCDVFGGERRRDCSLRAWLEVVAFTAKIDDILPQILLELIRDWEDGDESGDAAHQRSLLVHRCFAEEAGSLPSEKTVRAAFPHLNCISDLKNRAKQTIRLVAQMLRRGLQVYYRRASPDDPRSSHDYEDVGHSLSDEGVFAFRHGAAKALNAAIKAKNLMNPMDAALEQLKSSGLKMAESSISNKKNGGYTRREVTTFRERRHPVSRDISGDASFATMNGRKVSAHDEKMEPRSAKLRDDGFVDSRDTSDSNPGQRSYMSVGTIISLRAPWSDLKAVADQLFSLLNLIEDDPFVALGPNQKILTVSGVPIGRFEKSRMMEVEHLSYCAFLRASMVVKKLENVSVEPTPYGLDLNGLPGRLLRVVLMKEVGELDETTTFESLREQGVARYFSQEEQLYSQVLSADDFSVKLPRYRIAREMHDLLRSGYRSLQISQINNGHPSRVSYSLKQAAAGAVNIEMIPTLAGSGKTVSSNFLSEGPFLPDQVACHSEYVSILMAVAFGCTKGTNHEDSISMNPDFMRGMHIAKDCAFKIPSFKIKEFDRDAIPSLSATSGVAMTSFQKLTKENSRLEKVDLIGNVDGRIVATFEEGKHLVTIVRKVLPIIDGHKIGFPFQKMTLATNSSPTSCPGLNISGVMHPPTVISRLSPGLLVVGLRRSMACGMCVTCGLSTAPPELTDPISQQQWKPSEFRAALVATPDISHTGDDETSISMVFYVIFILPPSPFSSPIKYNIILNH
jgi:hypothetical protein